MTLPQEWHHIVEGGNVEEIRSILEQLPPHKLQDFADMYLFTLAFEGQEAIIRYLHRHKLVVGARDETGATVLHYAALGGYLELVEYLHQQGADIRAKDKEGTTLLHAAAICGDIAIIEYCCEQGVEVNAMNVNGHTALHLVVVTAMLRERADPHYIAIEERETLAYLQQQGGDLEVADKDGRTVKKLLAMWQAGHSAPMWISKN